MALLSVLWCAAMLAVIAAALIAEGALLVPLTLNAQEAVQVNLLAEAATARAVLGLTDTRPDHRWHPDGSIQTFTFSGTELTLRLQSEIGKIDINYADCPTLTRLLQGSGQSTDRAAHLCDAILDWREPGTVRRLNGAKADDYAARGLHQRPRQGRFESIDELGLVLGITPVVFERIRPAITVYSGKQIFDPRFAPPEALAALPNVTSQDIGRILAERQRPAGLRGGTPHLPDGLATSVTIEGTHKGVAFRQTNIVRPTHNPADPYWLLTSQAASTPQQPYTGSPDVGSIRP